MVLAVAALAFLLAGIRIVGFTPYAVLSGSMEPAFHVGSLIYVKSVDPEDIKVGDAITFRLSGEDTAATHRVIEIDRENQCFYTKGDANETPDASPVPYSSVLGRAVFTVPKLGLFSSWLSSAQGKYAAISGVGLLLLLIILPEILFKAAKGKTKQG